MMTEEEKEEEEEVAVTTTKHVEEEEEMEEAESEGKNSMPFTAAQSMVPSEYITIYNNK